MKNQWLLSLTFWIAVSLPSCTDRQGTLVVETWRFDVDKPDIPMFSVDTIVDLNELNLDRFKIHKIFLDSLITEGNHHVIDDTIYLDVINQVEWTFENQVYQIFLISIVLNSNFIPEIFIYNNKFGVLMKKYHALNRAILIERRFLNANGIVYRTEEYNRLVTEIVEQTNLIPALPSPPPVPPEIE